MVHKAIQYGLGIGLIFLGIAGLFLPFLQGILLIVLGVVVLRADRSKNLWVYLKEKKAQLMKRR